MEISSTLLGFLWWISGCLIYLTHMYFEFDEIDSTDLIVSLIVGIAGPIAIFMSLFWYLNDRELPKKTLIKRKRK